jgi:hypothetical protein
VVRKKLDHEACRVDELIKGDMARGPADITPLDGNGLLMVGRIRSVEGPENFVLKKHAVESLVLLVSLARALDTPDTSRTERAASGGGGAATGSGAVVGAGDRESATAMARWGRVGLHRARHRHRHRHRHRGDAAANPN